MHLDSREFALQIVDIIALRPDIDICYIGISSKCFEVLENKQMDDRHITHDTTTTAANAGPGGIDADDHPDTEDEDNEEDDEDDDEDDPNQEAAATQIVDPDDSGSDASSDVHEDSDDDESDGAEDDKRRPRLRLREILFYDDKVSIFKARHGRL